MRKASKYQINFGHQIILFHVTTKRFDRQVDQLIGAFSKKSHQGISETLPWDAKSFPYQFRILLPNIPYEGMIKIIKWQQQNHQKGYGMNGKCTVDIVGMYADRYVYIYARIYTPYMPACMLKFRKEPAYQYEE